MRLGRVDIPDDRFRAVCGMGATAVGLLTVLCAEADESGMVTMSVRDITKSLNMRKSTVCETLHAIADIGVADVVTRRGSGTSVRFPDFSKVVPPADTLEESGSPGGHFGESGSPGGHFGESNFVCTSTTHTNIINNNTNNIKTNSITNNAYACTREEAPVERMDMEDREEAARLKGGLGYPATWQEVRDAAEAYAIVMTQDEAEGFLAKYASVGWVRSGARIRDWRYLIPAWHNNWQQVEIDNKARRTNGSRCNDRGNAGAAGGDCWGQAKFSGKYGPATTEEEFLRMVGDDD